MLDKSQLSNEYSATIYSMLIQVDWFLYEEILGKAIAETFRKTQYGDFSYEEIIAHFRANISPKSIEDKKSSFYGDNALGVDLVIDAHRKLQFLKFGFKEDYDLIESKISGIICFIEDLYESLANFGLIESIPASEDQKEAFNSLFDFIIRSKTYLQQHYMVQTKLAADPAETMVFSIGSACNAKQMIPTFTTSLSGEISIYNFDYNILSDHDFMNRDMNIQLAEQSQENVNPEYFSINFPSQYMHVPVFEGKSADKDDITKDLSLQEANLQAQLTKIIDDYTQLLIKHRQQNPNFKLVILYCCAAAFDPVLLKFVEQLTASTEFAVGKNLEIIHTYFPTSPAIVYRDINKIPRVNPVLANASEKQDLNNRYDSQSDMYIFPNLDQVLVFDQLRPAKISGFKS